MRVDPELLREYARTVARASDEVSEMDSRGLWESAASACKGTTMVASFSERATAEYEVVRTQSEDLDTLSLALKYAAEVLEREDDSNGCAIEGVMLDRQ